MERKFKVSVSWEIEVTAVDEEDAYFKALDELDRQILDAVRRLQKLPYQAVKD